MSNRLELRRSACLDLAAIRFHVARTIAGPA
jgi:hypothetical protein